MCIALLALSSFLIASYELETWPWVDQRTFRERFEFHRVGRTTLGPIQSAPGRVESSQRTMLRCEMENLTGTGSSAGGGGATTLIWMLPEGTKVKSGEVVARLDAATYEEMLRQQTITVEQAKASHLQARLNHEIALLALREYMEGTVQETVQGMEGSIALARSDLSRAEQRLAWTMHMNEKGYSSVAQIATDRQTVATLDLALKKQLSSQELFQRFTLPKTEKTLQGSIKSAETSLNNELVRLQRQLERYAILKKQVDNCTIRAPHDGVLFYYKNPNSRGPNSQNTGIEEGMSVRQKQILFYLPDLSEMEVQLALNESVVNRILPGLRARVGFEALPNLVIEGRVESISQIPVQQSDRGEDIRYFLSIVKLDRTAPGLMPGMSARVEIALPQRSDVLAIPHRALVVERGHKMCWVCQGEDLVPREVKVGQGTTDLIEICEGLTEGQEIVLDPPGRRSTPQSLSGFLELEPAKAADPPKKSASAKASAPTPDSPSNSTSRRKGRGDPADGKRARRTPANPQA
jgi:HlyD family secretion protein